jgi:hypothetical protein
MILFNHVLIARRMDQDSTGSEDDANSIKDGIYFINDMSFYFQIGCYTVAAILAVYMVGLVHEKQMASLRGADDTKQFGKRPLVYSKEVRDKSASDSTSLSEFF